MVENKILCVDRRCGNTSMIDGQCIYVCMPTKNAWIIEEDNCCRQVWRE